MNFSLRRSLNSLKEEYRLQLIFKPAGNTRTLLKYRLTCSSTRARSNYETDKTVNTNRDYNCFSHVSKIALQFFVRQRLDLSTSMIY